MIIIDVPVELDQNFFILIVIGFGKAARIKQVYLIQDSCYFVDIGLSYAGNVV